MLAVAGGKGGCGKTTTTACLARELAVRGDRPVVVDADVGLPDLHVVADCPAAPGLAALHDGAPTAAALHRSDSLPGVRAVPAGEGGCERVPGALARLADAGDPVLVDTPAGASRAVAAPLRAADATLLVSTPTERSLADAAKTAAVARELNAPVVGVVLTRSDGTVDPAHLLDCEAVFHVPPARRPVDDARVTKAYVDCACHVSRRNV